MGLFNEIRPLNQPAAGEKNILTPFYLRAAGEKKIGPFCTKYYTIAHTVPQFEHMVLFWAIFGHFWVVLGHFGPIQPLQSPSIACVSQKTKQIIYFNHWEGFISPDGAVV